MEKGESPTEDSQQSEQPLNHNGDLNKGRKPVRSCNPPVADPGPLAAPCCSDGWVGYGGKCYYFSEAEGNWTYSRSNCSSLGASLAGIDSEPEMAFMLRYKGNPEHWIGLRREQELGQPWKWANGSEFNYWFPIRGGGDCAYLNDEKGVSSSRCIMTRYWICSKPDAYTKGKGHAMGEKLQI
ncbi:C-type lectin domain family 2 member D-like isoform X2 [Chrysemys picta bellii]|uniref:C-type lectin domain family 2 member D-like isoform X2 n=1 Tax=Chrysemys picta bellii TaxID=8478 RepID=UPI0032B28769